MEGMKRASDIIMALMEGYFEEQAPDNMPSLAECVWCFNVVRKMEDEITERVLGYPGSAMPDDVD